MTLFASRRSNRCRTALAVPVLLASAALLLAACSNGGSPSASGTNHTSSTNHTAPLSSSTTSTPSASTTSTFCSATQRYNADQNAIKQPGNSAAAILRAAKDAETAAADMQRLAPTSLSADVKAVTRAFKPFFDALVTDRGNLSQALPAEKQIASQVIPTATFQAAQSALSNYETQSCGSTTPGKH
jgi:hypothetical protein